MNESNRLPIESEPSSHFRFTEDEILFFKRYDTPPPKRSREPDPDIEEQWAQLLKLIKESFHPNDAAQRRRCEEFAQRAIAYSQKYAIDTAVTKNEKYYQAIFTLDYGSYDYDMKDTLADLLLLCDSFSFLRIHRAKERIDLVLTVYTYSFDLKP